MRGIKMFLWSIVVLPVVFICSVLSIPFMLICIWAGEAEAFDSVADKVGERLKLALINFAD